MRDARGKTNNEERMIWIMQRGRGSKLTRSRLTRGDKLRLERGKCNRDDNVIQFVDRLSMRRGWLECVQVSSSPLLSSLSLPWDCLAKFPVWSTTGARKYLWTSASRSMLPSRLFRKYIFQRFIKLGKGGKIRWKDDSWENFMNFPRCIYCSRSSKNLVRRFISLSIEACAKVYNITISIKFSVLVWESLCSGFFRFKFSN